jgi:hypothetical protein
MARVTGIGGIFLRARDPKSLSAWYAKHLGIQLADYGGATLLWSDEVPPTTGMTTWSLFPENTKHFGPGNEKGPQQAMINYRVDDLDTLLTQLAAANIPSTPTAKTASTAASPGSLTPKATASNSGNPSHSRIERD